LLDLQKQLFKPAGSQGRTGCEVINSSPSSARMKTFGKSEKYP
jgi:hypothetical protein